jgi:hypothetical protein
MTNAPDLSRRMRDALAGCYPQPGLARLFASDAGLNLAAIDFSSGSNEPGVLYSSIAPIRIMTYDPLIDYARSRAG